MSAVLTIRRAKGFEDPAVQADVWDRLLRRGDTDEVFLTPVYQRVWWESFGRGELMLLIAEQNGEPSAIAPLFADTGMVYFVGSGGSDFLDFIGDIDEPGLLQALLAAARDLTPGFQGFVFYHVPDTSRTAARLRDAAQALGWEIFEEAGLPAPLMRLTGEAGAAAARKKSLVRHENGLRRTGELDVQTRLHGAEAEAALEQLFAQHIERWAGTPHPSLFLDPAQKAFYRRLVAANADWLRLARIQWNGEPVALHLGFHHAGRYLWYKPSFAVEHARRSPGEVLLRQLILAAVDEGAEVFDFGLGDEAFKSRFATEVRQVRNWSLYPGRGSAA